MLTLTIRWVHLAIAGAFVAGILIAGGLVLALGGGDDEPRQDAPVLANIDEAPTSVPTAAPSATPAPSPTPAPTAAPQIRTCAEIRGTGTYNSDEERAFFLANCTTQTGASAGPPAASSGPSTSGATPQEAEYRLKAEANITVQASKVGQYFDTLENSLDTLDNNTALAKFYEFGALLRQFAAELDRLPQPPPRFAAVHAALKTQLIKLADHVIKFETALATRASFEKWFKDYLDIGEAMDGALHDYSLVVGVDLPEIFN